MTAIPLETRVDEEPTALQQASIAGQEPVVRMATEGGDDHAKQQENNSLRQNAVLPDGTIPLEGEILTRPFPGAGASERSRFGRRPYR
jgi:hypothetical protein